MYAWWMERSAYLLIRLVTELRFGRQNLIVGIKAAQDQGKTSLMVACIVYLIKRGGYRPDECYSNVDIRISGFHALNSEDLKKYVAEMIVNKYRHKIIGLDEVDRIFSHRFWNDKKQTEALLGLWQDVKLFNYIFWTAHLGRAVDLLLRETTQMELIPYYVKLKDKLVVGMIDTVNQRTATADLRHISRVFPLYDRWAVVE